jgi:glycerol-3-phosphate dehydrogenase
MTNDEWSIRIISAASIFPIRHSSFMNRSEAIHAIRTTPLDVLIIGGGIVGAGIARDAAMRGLRAGLVEQHDFASGTSSRTSRLLHGGLRYLAQGRLGLVRQASLEKRVIHQIAPHLAAPLAFMFPAYRGNREWKHWQLKLGVKIYDLLCGGKNFAASAWHTPEETLQRIPALCSDGLTGAVSYFDGFTNDARLVLDTLHSAANHGAIILNYSRLDSANQKQELGPTCPTRATDLWNGEISDQLTGQKLSVQAQTVVNATGPWAETLPHSRVKLRLTKGVHLVVDRARLPVPTAVVMPEGKRILFAIPWDERTILGTTDTDYEGCPEDVRAEPADIRYLIEVANRYFPQACLTASDVISSWAGLRPLLANPRGDPSEISRSHEIRSPEPGWWDVAGGKLTTYRLMAEQTVNQIAKSLIKSGALNREIAPCRTATEPLLASPPRFSGLVPPEFCREAVEYFCAHECAVHLDDVMIRRTNWQYYHPDVRDRATQVARWMGEFLNWDDRVRHEEIERLGLPP